MGHVERMNEDHLPRFTLCQPEEGNEEKRKTSCEMG